MYNLTDITTVKRILKKFGFRFSKSLGQNFLIDENIPRLIAEKSGIDGDFGVIEIGPGVGTLTAELAKFAKKVVSIEIDKALIPVLGETLKEFDNIKLVNSDVMKTDINKIISEEFEGLKVAVCANLPYYITTPVIMHLLECRLNIESITVMVQKEVAQRLCAKAGTSAYGSITLAVNYYTKPEILFEVKSSSFYPEPKVDSAVIKFEILGEPPVKVKDERLLFAVIKAAFSQRRKTLVNALCNNLTPKIQKPDLTEILNLCGIPVNIRGEMLDLSAFSKLSDIILEYYQK